MRFQTKKELLRYLGKNEDDRKLVTRMIERGEVRLENRMYVIEEESSVIEEESSSSGLDLANHLSNDLENRLSSLSNDLEYLNREYEKLEGLLDYSLRKCYDIMKKKGLVGSEDIYDDFYENITAGYSDENITAGYSDEKITEGYSANSVNVAHTTEASVGSGSVVERGNGGEKDLGSIMNKFGIKKASDLI